MIRGTGKLHEKVYDVAVSDGRKIEAGHCKTPVGNTVERPTGSSPSSPAHFPATTHS
jgi:hypothetical protein